MYISEKRRLVSLGLPQVKNKDALFREVKNCFNSKDPHQSISESTAQGCGFS